MNTLRILFILLLTCSFCRADHRSELEAFQKTEPVLAAKYAQLIPTFPELEIHHYEESRDSVLGALNSVARRTSDKKQKTIIEERIKSWKSIMQAEVETAKELKNLVKSKEWLFIFRFVDGKKVESGYLTLVDGKINQRHVLIEGVDFLREESAQK